MPAPILTAAAPAIVAVATPVIRRLLEDALGGSNVKLATSVIGMIANEAGVSVDVLGEFAKAEPDVVAAAIEAVEPMVPEMIALYSQGLEYQLAALQAEEGEPLWFRAWRPGMMYLLGFLWIWNAVLLHVANAVWKIALPPMSVVDLLALTGILAGLYMGGHTVKDVVAKWAARGAS